MLGGSATRCWCRRRAWSPSGAAATVATSVALWWAGQNFVDLAPYINDARDLQLVLLGGRTGQGRRARLEYLLQAMGLSTWDHALARLAHLYGLAVMLAALTWAPARFADHADSGSMDRRTTELGRSPRADKQEAS